MLTRLRPKKGHISKTIRLLYTQTCSSLQPLCKQTTNVTRAKGFEFSKRRNPTATIQRFRRYVRECACIKLSVFCVGPLSRQWNHLTDEGVTRHVRQVNTQKNIGQTDRSKHLATEFRWTSAQGAVKNSWKTAIMKTGVETTYALRLARWKFSIQFVLFYEVTNSKLALH